MFVEIHLIGDSDWPRYFLSGRSHRGIRFWNGEEWVSEFDRLCLYAFLPEVCREFERSLERRDSGHFVEEFEAIVRVKLHSDQPMSETELARFFNRYTELVLPTDGPTDESLVQAEIHWHELRKRRQGSDWSH